MTMNNARDLQVSDFHSGNEKNKTGLCKHIFYNDLVKKKITSVQYNKLLESRPNLLTWDNFLFQYIIGGNTKDKTEEIIANK
ncbi:MAG: hypothetical protein GY828_07405 [Candidatus Gracilibacteria bacterium]|nr:hypothetical protein [Candidatus Gracilibacteria bacterium]